MTKQTELQTAWSNLFAGRYFGKTFLSSFEILNNEWGMSKPVAWLQCKACAHIAFIKECHIVWVLIVLLDPSLRLPRPNLPTCFNYQEAKISNYRITRGQVCFINRWNENITSIPNPGEKCRGLCWPTPKEGRRGRSAGSRTFLFENIRCNRNEWIDCLKILNKRNTHTFPSEVLWCVVLGSLIYQGSQTGVALILRNSLLIHARPPQYLRATGQYTSGSGQSPKGARRAWRALFLSGESPEKR